MKVGYLSVIKQVDEWDRPQSWPITRHCQDDRQTPSVGNIIAVCTLWYHWLHADKEDYLWQKIQILVG